jgi:hypothetical protein
VRKRVKPRCNSIPCVSTKRVTWGNGTLCFGNRRAETNRPCDNVAMCDLDEQGRWIWGFSVSYDEAARMIGGLAELLADRHDVDHYPCNLASCTEWGKCANSKDVEND